MLKKTKQNRLKSAVLVAALACTPLFAHAAGLGRITVLSALGQPLKAELEVIANRDELNSLAAKLASADAFRLAGIEYVPVLSSLNFSRDIKDRSGKRYIEITTDRPLNEPFVDLLVELSWASGRLVREYTFLLDPPGLPSPVPASVVAPEFKVVPVSPVPAIEKTPEPASQTLVPETAASQKPATASARVATKAPALAVEKTASVASSERTRLVKPGDTLGRIASEAAPSGVSLDQMLIALFRNNADAFDGNMNRLRAGKILTVPDAEAAKSIDAAEARKEVLAQSADFNAYRKKLAGLVEAAPEPVAKASRSSGGKISPKVEGKAPPAASGKDKLEVSRTEASPETAAKPGGKGPAMQGRLSALEEDIVSRDRALREASGRIAQLERNLGDLKKLAELKSEAGATAQKQAEAAKPVGKPVPEPVAATAVKVPEAAPVLAPSPALSAVPPIAKPEIAPPPAAPAADAPKPPPPPKKPVLPPPEPEPEPDFIEENGPLVFGGAGVLTLLLGYLGFAAYRRKRQAKAEAAPLTQSELSNNSVFGDAASHSTPATDLAPSEFSVSESVADTGSSEAVDPLVEADTYLAFGRDAQAEEILLEALKNAPTRHPIHVKLLEIYAARRSPMQFNTLAQELRDQTGGQGDDWERARVLGQSLDPNNTLYLSSDELRAAETVVASADELSVKPTVDPDATMVFSAPPAMEAPQAAPAEGAADEVATLDFDLGLGDSPEVTSAATPVQSETSDTSSGLDFDLDLGESAPAEQAAISTTPDIDLDAPSPAPVDSNDVMALDIDFDLDTPSAAAVPVDLPVTEMEVVIAEAAPAPKMDEAMALDIDFDAPAAEVVSTPTVDRVAEDSNVMDFALDIEVPTADVADTGPSEPASVSALALDLPVEVPPISVVEPAASPALDFEFDIGEPTAAVADAVAESAAPTVPLDLSAISLDLDAPAEMSSSEASSSVMEEISAADESSEVDNPEAATKLELALAYEEMGDRDGARELLEEVVSEGSSAQRALAQSKLDALG